MTTDATDTTEADDATDGDGPDEAHRRPDGLDDATVAALGDLSAALEIVEQARGFLYGFHRLTGKADLALGDAVDSLRDAGHAEIADLLERDLVGRNVVEGPWTYQLVEDYDDGYHAAFREHEKNARDALAGGRRHLFEAEMKEARRSHGRRHHEALPRDRADGADRADRAAGADRDADEADGTTEPTA